VRDILAVCTSVVIAVILGGCAVAVRPMAPRPVVVQTASAVDEDDGAPPPEYIVESEQPVFYDVEPGVAFYPVFFGYPGSCFCYMPVRYVGGVWFGPGHREIYRGHFAEHRGGPAHLNAWRSSGGHFGGHAAVRGHMERGPGGRVHVTPPASHAQHFQQRQQQRAAPHAPAPHAAPQHNAPQQHVAPRPAPRPAPQVHTAPRPASEVRAPAPRPAPARAPARSCSPGKKC